MYGNSYKCKTRDRIEVPKTMNKNSVRRLFERRFKYGAIYVMLPDGTRNLSTMITNYEDLRQLKIHEGLKQWREYYDTTLLM